jgi:hypothetical protein
VGVQEIGSTKVTVFRQDKECPVSTVVVRAATQNVLDDIERAIGIVFFTHSHIYDMLFFFFVFLVLCEIDLHFFNVQMTQ